MKALRLALILINLCLLISCAEQSSVEVVQRGSLVRAANGKLYATGCLREAASTKDVAECSISEGEESSKDSAASARGRFAVGQSNYFDNFGFQLPGSGNSLNWNYPNSYVWNLNQFYPNSLNGFFQNSGQNVWGDSNGWLSFLYGRGYEGYPYGCRGNCSCDTSWLNGYGFDSGLLGNTNQNCGTSWDYRNGYGYGTGYGGYYPAAGEKVVELVSRGVNTSVPSVSYSLEATPVQAGYYSLGYVIKHTTCTGDACSVDQYRNISKSQFDYILYLINGISTTGTQAVSVSQTGCTASANIQTTLRAKNGAITISDLIQPCGQDNENPDYQAMLLRRYFAGLLSQSQYSYLY